VLRKIIERIKEPPGSHARQTAVILRSAFRDEESHPCSRIRITTTKAQSYRSDDAPHSRFGTKVKRDRRNGRRETVLDEILRFAQNDGGVDAKLEFNN
jgi:hypothetical protein